MSFDHTKSNQAADEIGKYVPGAIQSGWRKSAGFVPTVMSHAQGARMWDVDGNEYIDYNLGYGPNILGHNNEHWKKAIIEQMDKLSNSEVCEIQGRAAEKICQHLPGAELVRFAVSGSETNQNIFRLARAYTGKNKIVRFHGQYHGSNDDVLCGIVKDPENPVPVAEVIAGDVLSEMGNTGGRRAHAFDDMFMIEWNDLEAVENLFKQFGHEIAGIIMEPVMTNFHGCLPEPGYLEGVRKLCDEHGVLLIFDEVLTGFRIGLSGAQGHFGVTPDITTLAKALGGGFPVAALAGKREVMDTLTNADVMMGGTYNGNALAMAAVIATIEELEKDDGEAFKRIERLGNKLKDGLVEINTQVGSNLLLQGYPGAWSITFANKDKIINYADSLDYKEGMFKGGAFGGLLKERGILTLSRYCTSAAHTEEDVDDALNRSEDALRELEKTFGK